MKKDILNPDNKRGQSISFRYFADTRLKALTGESNGVLIDAYPLYVEVKVKRQAVQRKCYLNIYVIPDQLDAYIEANANHLLVETNKLREFILSHKPFENDTFKLSTILKDYKQQQDHELLTYVSDIKTVGKIKITPAQLRAIGTAGDILSAHLGGMDDDTEKEFKKAIRGIDAFLQTNGFKREFN